MAKIDEAFNKTISMIDTNLSKKRKEEKERCKEVYRKSNTKMNSKQKKLSDIKVKLSELSLLKNQIETELENLDPKLERSEIEAFNKKHWTNMNEYYTKKSELKIAAELKKTTADKNYNAWRKILEQTKNLYSLAITAKQKQEIIINLQQSVDWRELGIELPNLFEINKVEINKWVIILNNALPDNSKS